MRIASSNCSDCLQLLKLMSYKEMDQTHWACYQLPGKTYYYGEVAILDQGGVVLPKDAPDTSNPKNKLVKHGFGIYLYSCNEQGQFSRYEGSWDRDRKHGQGKLVVPGEFSYEGEFKDGSYHEHGKMTWSNGDSYEGTWKKGRMEGGGIFKHHEGFVLKGSFKANHFVEDNILRNPQMGEKEYLAFKKQRKEVVKQKERNEKVKHGFVVKVSVGDSGKLLELVTKSNKNNRVPLIIASEASKFNLASLEERLNPLGKAHSFDLRKAYVLKGEQKFNYKNKFAEMTRSALKEGGSLLINLDQSEVDYKQSFYPELREFYDSNGFNSSTWSRDIMRRKESHEKLTGGQINSDYVIGVWSKVKVGEELSEQRLREKLQLRFQTILPFIKIDIIFVVA